MSRRLAKSWWLMESLWRGRPFGRLRAGSRPRNAFRRKASSRGPSGPRDLACTSNRLLPLLLWLLPLILLIPHPAQAYVGPGAGFAVLSSFWTLFVAFFYSAYAFLTWPFRFLFRWLRHRRAYRNAQIKHAVILGFDGMDPELADRFMREGILPNFARLRD